MQAQVISLGQRVQGGFEGEASWLQVFQEVASTIVEKVVQWLVKPPESCVVVMRIPARALIEDVME